MPLTIRVDLGFDAEVTCPTRDAAIAFLSRLGGPGSAPVVASAQDRPDEGDQVTAVSFDEPTDEQLRQVVETLRGNDAAKAVHALARAGDAQYVLSDKALRERAGWPHDYNIGPVFSHISKTCMKAGIGKGGFIRRKMERSTGKLTKRHANYFYKLNPRAARMILSIPNYTDAPADDFHPIGRNR